MQKNTGFQPSSESEDWSLGGIVQGMVNIIFSKMKKQKNVSWQSKENKLSLKGKNDGEGGSFINSSCVLGVLSTAVMNSWHVFEDI